MRPGDRRGLCLLPAALAGLDAHLTLCGQPETYWRGDLTSFQEVNPIAAILLACHPGAFAAGGLLWIGILSLTIFALPLRPAKFTSLIATVSQCLGAASWIAACGFAGWVGVLVLFLTVDVSFRACWRRAIETSALAASLD